MQITTKSLNGGCWMGLIDGETVCGPYLNKGMATRQANRIAAKRAAEAPKADPMDEVREAARAEARKIGLSEAQIEAFLATQSI